MQKPFKLIMTIVLAGLLAACNLPAVTTSAPAATQKPDDARPVPTAAETAPSPATPAAAALPPTETSLPPAVPPPSGPVVVLDQVHMLTSSDGWGWTVNSENVSRLLRTTDGGQTWRDFSPQGELVYYGSFFLNSQAAWLTFYNPAANSGGMLRTTDGGQTWVTLPPNDILQNALVEFTSLDEGLAETAGLGAGNAYLNYYQTRDSGASWQPILLIPPQPEPGLPEGTIHLCNMCGDNLYYDPARVVITHGDMVSDPAGVVRLSVSADLGRNWKDIVLPFPDHQYITGSVMPLAPVFFGSQGLLPVNIMKYNQDGTLAFSVLAVYTSQDGGQSWKAIPTVLETSGSMIDSVQFLSAREGFVRCGSNLCSTSDGAQTWSVLPESLNFDRSAAAADYVSQVSFIDPATGWALAGESGATTLWKSSDGGATWTKLSPILVE